MEPAPEEVDAARSRLLEILRRRAVLRGDFLLSSGQHSTYYIDARQVTLSSEGSYLVAELFLRYWTSDQLDAVAGLAVGADPIVAAIATVAGLTGRSIDGVIVRKDAKAHGTGGRLVGPWSEGMRVAVVDDTFTTGASALVTARAIEEAGGHVVGVYALIDREQGAREAIEANGYSFTAIFRAKELL
jgi:orotate phosphoribosyltransferase